MLGDAPLRFIGRRPTAAFLVSLALLLLVVFGPHLGGEWVWDDVYVVEKNPNLDGIAGLEILLTHDAWGSVGQRSTDLYHPLPMALLWLENLVFGRSVAAFRVVSIALHAACTTLLFAWLRKRGLSAKGAAFTSLLFSVHPLVTEPVMWITAQNDTLATAFCLLALLAVPSGETRRPLLTSLVLGAATAGAALCKEPYFVLPLVIALAALVTPDRAALRRAAALVIGPFVAIALVVLLRHALGIATGSQRTRAGLPALTADYLTIVFHYLRHVVTFMNPLTTDAYRPLSFARCVAVFIVIFAISAVLAARWRAHRRSSDVALVGWGWFLVPLLPHMLATPVIGMYGNRYAYFPMMGLFACGLAALEQLTPVLARRWRLVLALGSPLPIAVSSIFTASETLTWRSGLTLFGADVDRDRGNPRAIYHYGNEVRFRVGCLGALPYFQRAAALDPAYTRALHNVTGCLIDLRRYRDASVPAEAAYRLSPDDPGVVYNVAVVSLALGDAARARSLIERALSLDPKHSGALALSRSLMR